VFRLASPVPLHVVEGALDVCRREYEANAEPHVVDAARRSIQALAETGRAAKAVKAGETAPLFTYVLDSTGLDADYTTRLEPTEIIAALAHLRRCEHSRQE
jgi:hypothetical protein